MAQFPNSTGPNSGVWTLEDVYNARIGGNWPDATANRGIFSAGLTPSQTDIMDFVNISSAGNATDFGNLDASLFGCGSVSSSTRGVVGGGGNPANDGVNTLQYVTILTTGNTQDFGDLNSSVRVNGPAGVSNSTRGLFAGGEGAAPGYPTTNVIDYITIASTSNATDFGDLAANGYTLGGTASGTRGVFAGGKPGNVNTIQYVTINSTGNTSDFGDLTVGRGRIGSGVQSSGTRGIFSGGETPVASNIIDYITIASTGNATDFGDLTNTTSSVCGATSNTITALTSGMSTSTNTIDFVTIASTGNASDFGDLTVGRLYITGMSNVHGGLS
tara:strand:+ start:1691 stop:2680 length:990 start_codon:yes stop_codon:yes gene_type:complete